MANASRQQQPAFELAPALEILDGTIPPDRRELGKLAFERVTLGANWLAGLVKPDGALPYFYYPERDSYYTSTYNEVRHAGTTYALFQTASLLDDARVRSAAERAAVYILNSCLSVPSGGAAFLYQGRNKLGGQGLALVALLERRRSAAATDYDDIIEALAMFLLNSEVEEESGRYYQSYLADRQTRLLTPNSNYYPGEALLALTRLADQFPDGPWLSAAQRAARFLIYRKDGDIPSAGKIPREDHWLTLALSDLYRLDPNPVYATIAFMQANAMIANQISPTAKESWTIGGAAHPRSVNFTSTATKGEALTAAWSLSRYIDDLEMTEKIANAALTTAQFQMRVQYTEQNISHFSRPDRVLGAWAQDIHNPRIRIDYVQHNISALTCASLLAST